MRKLVDITVLILILVTTIVPQTGCTGKTEDAEPTASESNRWLELLKVLPENEETLKGVVLQDIAYFEGKKGLYSQNNEDYAVLTNLPQLFGQSPHAYNDEEWEKTLGFVQDDLASWKGRKLLPLSAVVTVSRDTTYPRRASPVQL